MSTQPGIPVTEMLPLSPFDVLREGQQQLLTSQLDILRTLRQLLAENLTLQANVERLLRASLPETVAKADAATRAALVDSVLQAVHDHWRLCQEPLTFRDLGRRYSRQLAQAQMTVLACLDPYVGAGGSLGLDLIVSQTGARAVRPTSASQPSAPTQTPVGGKETQSDVQDQEAKA